MSLIDTIQAGVETAFEAAKELVRLGDYYVVPENVVYDPITDDMTGAIPPVSDVRFLETSHEAQEREASQVSVTDLKFIVPFVDLKGADPTENDKIVLDGVLYNVVLVKKPPGQGIYIIFCRKA